MQVGPARGCRVYRSGNRISDRTASTLGNDEHRGSRLVARHLLRGVPVLTGYQQRGLEGVIGNQERPGDRVAFVMLVAFVVVMYAIPGEWIAPLKEARLALLAASIAATFMLLRRLFKLEPLYVDGLRGMALLAFALLAQASVSWSIYPEASRVSSAELLKSAAIYFTMVNVVTTPRRLIVVCAAVVLAAAVPSIGAIDLWRKGSPDLIEGYRTRWWGVFADPNYLAMNVAVIFPIAMAFVTRSESTVLLRIACAVSAGLVVTTIVLTHSRGSLLGFIAGVAVWAFREKRRVQAILVGFVLLISLLVFAPPTFWRRSETIAGFQSDASAMSRVHAWEAAANMNKAHPLLGIGTGAFLYGWPIYRPAEETMAHVAHNMFLDVVSELGFVGLMLFLIFLGGAVGGAFQASRYAEQAWLARGIAAAGVTYLTGSLFLSGYTISAHLYVLCGLAACADRISRKHWASAGHPEGIRARAVSPMTPFAGGLGH